MPGESRVFAAHDESSDLRWRQDAATTMKSWLSWLRHPAAVGRCLAAPPHGCAALAITVTSLGGVTAQTGGFDDWRYRLPVAVSAEGLTEVAVPPAVLDVARPGFVDLRLADPGGEETGFIRVEPISRQTVAVSSGQFHAALADGVTRIELETPGNRPVEAVTLRTPTARFLVAVRVEGRVGGEPWKTLAEGVPIFRQANGAEQLRVTFPETLAKRLRLTVGTPSRGPSVAFEGAALDFPAGDTAEPVPVRGEILERVELPGHTRLVVDFGAAHLDLDGVGIETDEPLFTRRITMLAPSIEGAEAREKPIAKGTIFRVAMEGADARDQLMAPVRVTTPLRRLILIVENGDSPPLAIDGVIATRQETRLRFLARGTGEYALFAGNPLAEIPRYDLAALASSLQNAQVARVPLAVTAPLPQNPGYTAPAQPAGIPLRGAVLDTASWAYRKPVTLGGPGIRELELDAETLARTGTRGSDWRLVAGDRQVPYLVERAAFSRSLEPKMSAMVKPDPDRPSIRGWELKTPHAGLPATSIICRTGAPLFKRSVTLVEEIEDNYGQVRRRELGRARWQRTPGENKRRQSALELPLSARPETGQWILEMDNGDNAAIELTDFEVRYPVVRLLFKNGEPLGKRLFLFYGNPEVSPPRYDLALAGPQLLRAVRSPAVLQGEEILDAASGPLRIAGQPGVVFWGVLIVVVTVLVFLVAKLLPNAGDEDAPPPVP